VHRTDNPPPAMIYRIILAASPVDVSDMILAGTITHIKGYMAEIMVKTIMIGIIAKSYSLIFLNKNPIILNIKIPPYPLVYITVEEDSSFILLLYFYFLN